MMAGNRGGSGRMLLFIVYLVFGLYFLNSGLSFITLPGFLEDISSWISIIGGALLIIGGFFYMKASKRPF